MLHAYRLINLHPCACILGHGPSSNIVEGGSSVGMSGYHPGDVDPPEGVAALWRPYAPRESRLCLVKGESKLRSVLTVYFVSYRSYKLDVSSNTEFILNSILRRMDIHI